MIHPRNFELLKKLEDVILTLGMELSIGLCRSHLLGIACLRLVYVRSNRTFKQLASDRKQNEPPGWEPSHLHSRTIWQLGIRLRWHGEIKQLQESQLNRSYSPHFPVRRLSFVADFLDEPTVAKPNKGRQGGLGISRHEHVLWGERIEEEERACVTTPGPN